jgi:N6-L-threonylcarbamoyladenine synthase
MEGDENSISFPIAKIKNSAFNFSFSGLKTAVLNHYNEHKNTQDIEKLKANICASFQKNVALTLANKVHQIYKDHNVKNILISGGVAANSKIKETFLEKFKNEDVKIIFPRPILCTDNAAMVAELAFYKLDQALLKEKLFDLNAYAKLKFYE